MNKNLKIALSIVLGFWTLFAAFVACAKLDEPPMCERIVVWPVYKCYGNPEDGRCEAIGTEVKCLDDEEAQSESIQESDGGD